MVSITVEKITDSYIIERYLRCIIPVKYCCFLNSEVNSLKQRFVLMSWNYGFRGIEEGLS